MWEKAKSNLKLIYDVFRAAGKEFGEDRVARMSAAVAYRTIFALAPLLLVAVFVFGVFIGSDSQARVEILDAVDRIAGGQVEDAVRDVLASVEATGDTAGIVGIALLFWTASSLFMELQNNLNDIFHVPHEQTRGVIAFVRKRGIGFLFAFGLGVVVIAVWLLNFLWNLIEGLFPEEYAPIHDLIGVLAPLVSLVILPLVIALSFQVLSPARVRWRAVWWGSFFTSVAFLIAAYGTGFYFSQSGSTAVGVAGSIFIILLLAFVLSTVFFFGAEVTKIYNDYLELGDVQPPEARARATRAPVVVVSEPDRSLPLAAMFAFFGGLFVGWWRRR